MDAFGLGDMGKEDIMRIMKKVLQQEGIDIDDLVSAIMGEGPVDMSAFERVIKGDPSKSAHAVALCVVVEEEGKEIIFNVNLARKLAKKHEPKPLFVPDWLEEVQNQLALGNVDLMGAISMGYSDLQVPIVACMFPDKEKYTVVWGYETLMGAIIKKQVWMTVVQLPLGDSMRAMVRCEGYDPPMPIIRFSDEVDEGE